MIKNREPLSMAESLKYIEEQEDINNETGIKKFIKKFVKLKPEEANKIRENLLSLGLLKLKNEYIVKIIDIMPENQENLNKIFTDVNLNEDEAKKILEILQEFR